VCYGEEADDHESEVGFPGVPALSHRSRPQNGMAGCNREDSTTFVPMFRPAIFLYIPLHALALGE
jgi:hypothetical protein